MNRVLLVNGNSSQSVTERLVHLARAAAPGTEFIPATPEKAPRYVSTPEDVLAAAPAVLDAIAASGGDPAPDACLIACFGEPGLFAARSRFPFPVLGMAQASVLQALHHGPRYAVLTLGEHWPVMLPPLFERYGLGTGCVGIERVEGRPLDLAADPETAARLVETAAQRVADRLAPDAIIIGGAALTGLTTRMADRQNLPPLIDCLHASIAQIGAAIGFGRLSTPAS